MQHKMSWMGYCILALAVVVTSWVWLSGNNQAIFYKINALHTLFPIAIWKVLNFIAYSKYALLPIVLLIVTLLYRRDYFSRVCLIIVSYYIIFHLLKLVVGEARPYIVLPTNSFFWLPNVDAAKDAYRSFPSGHVGLATIFSLTLIQIFNIRNIGLKLLLLLFIILVGVSRVCTGWHWPLDTLFSGLIGFILVKICFIKQKSKVNY